VTRKTNAARSESSRRRTKTVIAHRDDLELELEKTNDSKPLQRPNPISKKHIEHANTLLFRAWKKTYENRNGGTN
jgi:hypothetical protein